MNSDANDNWVAESKNDHREIFSELDVLLRALDRFFHIENLPIAKEDLSDKNFYDELNAVRDVIFSILGILEVVIPESRKNAYWFQKFAESKFLTDHSRDIFREKLYTQDTPEKGMFLLYDLFINLKGIITDLLKTGEISYLSYINIGQLISKEIRENRFLNPFKYEINPEYDGIENPQIAEIVRSIKDRGLKKHISLLYLYLFRFLRYIRFVDITSQHPVALHASLLILILLRSEINMFSAYAKKVGDAVKDEKLRNLLQSVSYQFSMETKRVYIQEMKDIIRKKAPNHFRGKIENSQGILKNLIEQSVVQITQSFNREISGEEIFESFTTKLSQSLHLREDLFALHRFLTIFEEKSVLPEPSTTVFKSLKKFMHHFENSTFKLLRYDDYDEFAYFFGDIFPFKGTGPEKLLEKIHNFKIFLETTLRNIANRAELKDKPVDLKRVEETVKQYL